MNLSLRGPTIRGRILADTLTVGGWTTAVKAAGAVKVLLMARVFGTSDALDAYLIAFLLPSFVSDALAGSLSSALVPTFVEVREREGRASAQELAASIVAAALAFLGLAAVLVAVASPVLLHLVAAGFAASKLALTEALFLLMLPVIPLSGASVAWRALLNAEQRFAAAAAIPVVTPAISILLLLILGTQWGVWALAAGTAGGCAMEVVLLGASVLRTGYSIRPRWSGRSAAVRQVFSQYAPLAAGTLLLSGAPLIDQSMATSLGSGSVSALNFGTKLALVLLAIGPTAMGTAVLPHFSLLSAQQNWRELRRTLRGSVGLILLVTLPLTAALMWLSGPIVRVLFARGAFTESSARMVEEVQRLSFTRIPFAVLLALVLRLLSSWKANQLMLPAAGLGLALTVVLNYIFMRWLGVPGIALSATAVNLALLAWLAPKALARMRGVA